MPIIGQAQKRELKAILSAKVSSSQFLTSPKEGIESTPRTNARHRLLHASPKEGIERKNKREKELLDGNLKPKRGN